MSTATAAIAAELSDWFQSVQHLTDKAQFSIAPHGPHRDAVILNVLMSNARLLSNNPIDNGGRLYPPLCFFLTAAVEKLHQTLRVGHWRVAVENVIQLNAQLTTGDTAAAALGLNKLSAVAAFKEQLDQTLIQAGLTSDSTYLDKDNREIALGLAVNWGLRFLLAYSVHCVAAVGSPEAKDLRWIARLMADAATQT